MHEQLYFTLSVDRISGEESQQIIEFVAKMRGTYSGMSITYGDSV